VYNAIAQRVGIPFDNFSVHKFKPEDFLIVFADGHDMDRVAALSSLSLGSCSLFFRRCNRLAQTQRVVAESRVHLVIEGIPPHAWDRSTAEHLLGTSCALEELTPETASREDLGLFKATAWTHKVDGIPPERMLWVPEPVDGVPPSGPQPVQRLRDLGMLEYMVLIHLSWVEEFLVMEGPTWANSPGSGQSGLLSRDSSGSGRGGFWTTRNVQWSLGRLDPKGGGSAGGEGSSGGGHGGRQFAATAAIPPPSDWRLPRIEGPVHVPVASRIATRGAVGTFSVVDLTFTGSRQNQPRAETALGAEIASGAPIAILPVAASLVQSAVKAGPDVPSQPLEARVSQNQGGKNSLLDEVPDPKAQDLGGIQSLVEEVFCASVHAMSACSGDSSPPGDKTVDLQGLLLEDGELSCSQTI
jgi:hypothetical protein